MACWRKGPVTLDLTALGHSNRAPKRGILNEDTFRHWRVQTSTDKLWRKLFSSHNCVWRSQSIRLRPTGVWKTSFDYWSPLKLSICSIYRLALWVLKMTSMTTLMSPKMLCRLTLQSSKYTNFLFYIDFFWGGLNIKNFVATHFILFILIKLLWNSDMIIVWFICR